MTVSCKCSASAVMRSVRLSSFGLSMAVTKTEPRGSDSPDNSVALSIIRTCTPDSMRRAANATERSSSPLTLHAMASAATSILGAALCQGCRPSFRYSGTVTAGSPYIMLKFQAVVSYMRDEPSRSVRCRSSTRTDFLTSASNSRIAATRGASG